MVTRETSGNNVDRGVIAIVSQGLQAIKGLVAGSWMNPGQPITPTAPDGAAGRTLAYTPGFNLLTNQRYEAIGFTQLKLLARNCDLVALAIETRKDQLQATSWEFRVNGQEKRGKAKDPRIQELETFFALPDVDSPNLPFKLWQRKLMDDILIIDQPVLHFERNKAGKPYAFTIIDGQTMKPILDVNGKMPKPPSPSWQQWLYGSPAGDFTSDEIICLPRHPRPDKIYGYSEVEQIYITIEIAIRRQIKKLGGYTDGNIPEAMVPTPESWGPDQIAQFQLYFDALLSGQLGGQRKMRFVPAGMDKAIFPNDPKSDDVNGYDEYLARVVCFAFSLSPSWIAKAMNKATAEQAADGAEEEGLRPLIEYWKILMKLLIFKGWGWTDIDFEPQSKRAIDPLKQAQADQIRTNAGHLSIDEVRQDLGEVPIGQTNAVLISTGLVTIGTKGEQDAQDKADQAQALADSQAQAKQADAETAAAKGDGAGEPDKSKGVVGVVSGDAAEKLAKADAQKKKLKMLPMTGAAKAQKHLAVTLTKFFKKQAREIVPAYVKAMTKDASDKLDLSDWETLTVVFKPQLEAVAKRAALQALAQLEITNEVTTELVSDEAVAYAADRAAELVGMKWDGTKLVQNPNAEWAITDSTRFMLKDSIEFGIRDGLSADALSDKLMDSYAFSEQRAHDIAQNELNMAHIQGNLEAWKGSGVVTGKQSILSSEHTEEDECNQAADDGVVPIDALFSTGDDAPPFHNRCECDLIAILGDRNALDEGTPDEA